MATETEAIQAKSHSQLISDESFVTVAGLATVVAMTAMVAGIVGHIIYGGSPPDGMDVYLTELSANHGGNMLAMSLEAGAHLLLLLFMVAMYHLFRDEGASMQLAVIAGSFGLLLLVSTKFMSMTEVELASRYVAADGATQPAIAAVAETVVRMKALVSLVGNLLAWGVGGLLFSLAILRSSILSRWLGYGGLVYAGVIWVTVVQVGVIPGVTSRDSIIFFFGSWFGIIWLIAMGIALVRVDEQSVM